MGNDDDDGLLFTQVSVAAEAYSHCTAAADTAAAAAAAASAVSQRSLQVSKSSFSTDFTLTRATSFSSVRPEECYIRL